MNVIQYTANEPPLQDKHWAIEHVAGKKVTHFCNPKEMTEPQNTAPFK